MSAVKLDLISLATDKAAQKMLSDFAGTSVGLFSVNLAYDFLAQADTHILSSNNQNASLYFYPKVASDTSGAGFDSSKVFFGAATLYIWPNQVTGPCEITVYMKSPNIAVEFAVFSRTTTCVSNPLSQGEFLTVDLPLFPWDNVYVNQITTGGGVLGGECVLVKNGLYIR